MDEFVEWGERIEEVPESLANPQLLGLLRACEGHPHFKVVELRRVDTVPPHVMIVVDASDGTIAPKNEAGLRPRERLGITFQPGGHVTAEVRALRADFPDVLHLNGVGAGEPASLCLYETWSHEERQWTPEKHLGRILWWLRHTADGTLHAQDQALEQLFYTTGNTVVLPAEFEERKAEELGAIYCEQIKRPDGRLYLVASTTKPIDRASTIQPLVVDLSPVENIPIQRAPRTLGELEEHLSRMGLELQPSFEAALKRQFRHSSEGKGVDGNLLLIVRIPRTRDNKFERLDCRGFLVAGKFEDVGIKLGALFRPVPGGPASAADDLGIGGATLVPETAWRSVPIDLVDLRHMPSRGLARVISGVHDEGADFAGVLAGVGSLGSVLADIWAREGWGRWTFIDPDYVAPHNLVRHMATSGAIGYPKVEVARAQVANALGHGWDASTAITASANDFERPDVSSALGEARLLVDASTTIEVPRDWSERDLPRSASVFFTYSGMSAVLLLEDEARETRLSALEAQYYRAILGEPWGEGHLHKAGQVRVGIGCRDHSLVLSYELVKLHAAQLARRLRKAVDSEEGVISIWTLDDATGGITAFSVPVHKVRSIDHGYWQVRWDEGIEIKLRAMREAGLPAETGGVLVGVIDQKLRTIAIVDASDAPPDSSAEATSFVRGTEGSQDYVSRCEELTGQMVSYVGEWHSHPAGHSADPSATDFTLLATLARRLAADGVPALMAIVSENGLSVSLGSVRS
ncbi:MAG: Mov34/MPN/PAD-1 family protein [Gammaproteobacteria bacterium]